MLYKILKWLFFLTAKGYFRSIYLQGNQLIPKDGPVLFVSNHSSAFMDPILLAVYIQRVLYFLARGDVFRKKMVASILNKLNMIPVYKPDLSPNEMHKNEMVFQKCYDHLGNGKTIIIFPEGVSKTERRLRPIKTGAARIALGAEAQYDFNLELQVIPIGINYSNPHSFRSDVFVNFGQPFKVNYLKEAYEKDQKEAANVLTERIKQEMERHVVIIEDERLDRIIKQIEVLYRSKLRDESKPGHKAPQDFYLSKDIVKAVEHYAVNEPERLKAFETQIDSYLRDLKRLKIRDTQVRSTAVSLDFFGFSFIFFFGFPIFLYGLIVNFIPYKIADLISRKESIREDFVGSIKMAAGMFIFLIIYFIQTAIFAHFTNFWWSLLFLLSLYPAGLFTINYLKHFYQFRGTFKYLSLFLRKSDLIAKFKQRRTEIVDQLEKAKEEFLDVRSKNM